MPSVALVTCQELPSGDEDADALSKALTDAGVSAEWLVWDDPAVTWVHDLVVVRSTWDYTSDRAAFLGWAHGVPRLANPADVMDWNSDKTYLRDLAAAGLPVVPTGWIEPGRPLDFPPGTGEGTGFVVKPSVGAGSRGAGRFGSTPDDVAAATEHARALHAAGRTVMVQPYLAEVDVAGETALIYVDGTFSHAIRKGAMLPPGSVNPLEAGSSHSLFVEERITPTAASEAEAALGERVLAEVQRRFGTTVLYARVDLLPSPSGPLLVELELTEPSLFLTYADGAAHRFAAAIAGRA